MKFTLITFCLLFLCSQLEAQQKKSAYYISRTGDTIALDVKVPLENRGRSISVENLQWKIKFYNKYGKKNILIPQICREVFISIGTDSVRLFSKDNTIGASAGLFVNTDAMFVERVQSGPLKAYRYYEKRQNSTYMYTGGGGMGAGGGMMIGGAITTISYALEKEGGLLFKPRWIYFKKDLAAYIGTCPQVLKFIADGDYSGGSLDLVARDYNMLCGTRTN